ncbi:hypothetical protein CsatA_022713 [Cannabis sativa]
MAKQVNVNNSNGENNQDLILLDLINSPTLSSPYTPPPPQPHYKPLSIQEEIEFTTLKLALPSSHNSHHYPQPYYYPTIMSQEQQQEENNTLDLINSPILTSPYNSKQNSNYIQEEDMNLGLTTLTLGFPCYHKDHLISTTPQDSHPLYPWARAQPCKVYSFNYLMTNKIMVIKGRVECNICRREFVKELDLQDEFHNIGMGLIREMTRNMKENRSGHRDGAVVPRPYATLGCKVCGHKDSVRPIVLDDNDIDDFYDINWLFLMLSQLLGWCTCVQLMHFCSTNKIPYSNKTYKDRLLFLTYMDLWRQFSGPN